MKKSQFLLPALLLLAPWLSAAPAATDLAVFTSVRGSVEVRQTGKRTLSRLNKGEKDKNLRFRLWMGKVRAKVRKLTSPRSSFEIEAGGVVCGVRGTEFTVDYDPATKTLRLEVHEGSVQADSEGKTKTYQAGQKGEFKGGQPIKDKEPQKDVKFEMKGKEEPSGAPNSALQSLNDMSDQLGTAALGNGDEAFTDPGVKGGVPVNVQLNLPPGEIP
jgi:hypothetical protein